MTMLSRVTFSENQGMYTYPPGRVDISRGCAVIVPSLPGCITYGRDVAHARKMAAAQRHPPSGGLLTDVEVAA